MSDMSNSDKPPREIIAPRHESLNKEFHGELGPRPLDYGEARLWLVARDPHWLFAYWQFKPSEHPEAAVEGGQSLFFIRILAKDGTVESETGIMPDAGNIYLAVKNADSSYTAELGFYAKSGVWCFISRSGIAYTPPESALDNSPSSTVFATRLKGSPILYRRQSASSLEDEALFSHLLAADAASGNPPEGRAGRARAELEKRRRKQIPKALLAGLDSAYGSSFAGNSSLSPTEANPLPLSLNAELIFHGSTSPDAILSIAGKPAKLRHDGTFRVHCSMPDGEYEIPILIRSADGKTERHAVLKFSRETVGHPISEAPSPDYLPAAPPGK
jgi:uncharacterized protein